MIFLSIICYLLCLVLVLHALFYRKDTLGTHTSLFFVFNFLVVVLNFSSVDFTEIEILLAFCVITSSVAMVQLYKLSSSLKK